MSLSKIDEIINNAIPNIHHSEGFDGIKSPYDEDQSFESYTSSYGVDPIIPNKVSIVQETNASFDSIRDFEEQNKNTLLLMKGTLDSMQNDPEMNCSLQEKRICDYDQSNLLNESAEEALLRADLSNKETPGIEGSNDNNKSHVFQEEIIKKTICAEQKKQCINKSSSNTENAKLPLSPKDGNIQIAANTQSKKKPFLKRGTRKEPSSIHRFQTANTVTRVGKVDSNDHLEHLEKMQRDQIEQLEKRIERRERSRVDRRTHNDKPQTRCGVNNNIISNNDKPQTCCGVNNNIISKKEGDNVADESDVDSSSDDSSYASSSSSSSSKSTQVPFHKVSKGQRIQHSRAQVAHTRVHSSNKGARKKGLEPRHSSSKMNQPDNEATRLKLLSADLNEQWQLIKAMRKRQEATLRAAEKEREEARSWASSERISLQKWTKLQRESIQKEKMRLNNTLLASQRRKRLEEVEEKSTEAVKFSHKKAKAEIDDLQTALNKQKVESDVARSRQRLTEKRLRDLVSERDDKIQTLQDELDLKSSEVKTLREEITALQKRFREKKNKRKSRSEQGSKTQLLYDSNLPNELADELSRNVSPKIEPRFGNIKDDLDSLRKGKSSMQNKSNNENSGPLKDCPIVPAHGENNVSMVEEYNISIEPFIDEPTNLWLKRLDSQIAERNHTVTKASTSITTTSSKQYDPNKYQGTPRPLNIKDLVKKTEAKQGSPVQKKEGCHPPQLHHLQGENDQKKMEGSYEVITGDNEIASESQTADESDHAKDNNKRDQCSLDDRRIISYQNGTKKEILPDGTIIVRFTNGDIKTSYKKVGITVYYYSEAKTSHTTHPDGSEVYEFPTGQIEKHYPDGRKEIIFPDGSKKLMGIPPHCSSQTTFHDGVQVVEHAFEPIQLTKF